LGAGDPIAVGAVEGEGDAAAAGVIGEQFGPEGGLAVTRFEGDGAGFGDDAFAGGGHEEAFEFLTELPADEGEQEEGEDGDIADGNEDHLGGEAELRLHWLLRWTF